MHRSTKVFTLSFMILLALVIAFAPNFGVRTPAAQAQGGDHGPGPEEAWTGFTVPLTPLSAPSVGEDGASNPTDIESVIAPTDGRKRVTTTTSAAYRWVVKLEMNFGGNLYICSGSLIAPRLVATAGHCVYNGGWASSIRVIPGQNGAGVEPYGYQYGTAFYSHPTWISSSDPNYDIGLIVLPDTTMGDLVGVFMPTSYLSNYFVQYDLKGKVSVTGYPGDKYAGGGVGVTMWTGSGNFLPAYYTMLNYDVDTYGGQSGSAVVATYQGKKFALATHAYGIGACTWDYYLGTLNCGARYLQNWWDVYNQVFGVYGNLLGSLPIYTDNYPAPTNLYPPDDALTNAPIPFAWDAHPVAVKYQMDLWKYNEKTYEWKRLFAAKKITSNSWTKSLGTGYYAWRVRIEQANKFPGQYSGWYYFEVDKKKPAKPVPIWPPNNVATSSPVGFEWSQTPDIIRPGVQDIDYYEFQIKYGSDSWSAAYTFYPTGAGISISASDGPWSWRVRGVDLIGNVGPWSKVSKVVVDSSLAISIGDQPIAPVAEGGLLTPPPPQTQSAALSASISIGDEDPTRPTRVPATAPDGTPIIPIG